MEGKNILSAERDEEERAVADPPSVAALAAPCRGMGTADGRAHRGS